MKLRKFNNVRFLGDWEYNFIGKAWSFRVGKSQIELFHNYKSVWKLK